MGSELEIVECVYLMEENERIVKGKKDLENWPRNIIENLAEREVDCNKQVNQVPG